MNILFLVNNTKISPNANGGASVYYSHLELLSKIGYTVHLLLVDWKYENGQAKISEKVETDYLTEVSNFYNSVALFEVAYEVPKASIKHLYNAVFAPEMFEYHFINAQNSSLLDKYCTEKQIDVIWAEWRWTALLAAYSSTKIPVIYAHHDWEYKLGKLRKKNQSLKHKFHVYQKKRVEMDLIRKVNACVSASYTETDELKTFGAKKALYIPLTYPQVTPHKNYTEAVSIVHLGGMGTTANRIGLERFLEVCWQTIKEKIPNCKLKVIGNLKYASKELEERLNDAQIECLGFIEDLHTVLTPYDIHIIPWEYNTGTRTRIPLVFKYAQVLVSTKAAASCYPEVVHEENSILSNDLTQMTDQIIDLYSNKEKRIFIGDNAQQTFLNNFTVEQQIKKLQSFLTHL